MIPPAKRLSSVGVAAFLFTGCASILGIDEVPLPAPITDAGGDATDAATADVSDAGVDAPVDAQVDSPVDAGCSKLPPPTHDGTVGVHCQRRSNCAVGEHCCFSFGSGTGTCTTAPCTAEVWSCEGARDCKGNEVCCIDPPATGPALNPIASCPWKPGNSDAMSVCRRDVEGNGLCVSGARLCHIGDACPAGMKCLALTVPETYNGFGLVTFGVCMRP